MTPKKPVGATGMGGDDLGPSAVAERGTYSLLRLLSRALREYPVRTQITNPEGEARNTTRKRQKRGHSNMIAHSNLPPTRSKLSIVKVGFCNKLWIEGR